MGTPLAYHSASSANPEIRLTSEAQHQVGWSPTHAVSRPLIRNDAKCRSVCKSAVTQVK